MDFFNMGNDESKPDNDNASYFETRSNHDNDSTSLSPQAILARNSMSEMSNGQNMSNSHISMSPQQMFTPMSGSNVSMNAVGNQNANSPAVGAATPQQILMLNNNNSQQGFSNQPSPIVQSNNDPSGVLPAQEITSKAYTDRAAMISSLQAKQQQQQRQQQQQQQQHQQNQQHQQQPQPLPQQPQHQQPQVQQSSPQPPLQPQPVPQSQPQQQQQAFNYRGGSVLQNLSPELQKQISIELNNKQYELFMKSLIENCKRRNMPLQSIPEIHGKKVNLFILFMLVQRLGGGEQVSRTQRWDLLSQKLQIQDAQQLASVYYKIVLPYENYLASPEGVKESQAKKIFFQQFFQELIRKLQENSKAENPAFNQSQDSTPNSSATPTSIHSFKQQQPMQQMQQSMQQRPPLAAKPKKPRKPRQKKKTKKELELERKQQEEMLRKQQQVILEQQQKQRLLVEHQLQRQKEMIRQQYQQELAKLPKVYKRGLSRNYKPVQRQMHLTNGYDMNYFSQIGEKIEANKPIFLFPPELGTVNLHALTMSLQSNDLGEVNTALNTLLVTSADSVLKVPLDKYPDTLDTICILGIKLLRDLFFRNTKGSKSLNCTESVPISSSRKASIDGFKEEFDAKGFDDVSFNSDFFSSGYCEDYDVKALLGDCFTSYSKTNNRINQIFHRYSQVSHTEPEKNTVISVDSLTGEDLQQSSTVVMTPAQRPKSDDSNNELKGNGDQDREEDNFIEWDVLPEPIKNYSEQSLSNLSTPSYLQSLKSVNDEINTLFTKVNTRGAEDKNIAITDQISTVSMILRNFSFSEKNSKLMAKNTFLKRFYLDLLWMLFLNHEMFVFHRKVFNLKKDTIVTLTNISHAYEIDSKLGCLLILMLILSFGEPRKNMSEKDSQILRYAERPLNRGHYSGFSADIFAKLLSLDHPNRQLFKDVLLLFPRINDDKEISHNETVHHLIRAYCGEDKFKLLNDVVCFLLSLIPFVQLETSPSIIEEMAPVIAQTLTCLLTLINFLDTSEAIVEDKEFRNIALRWLNAEENIGASLRRLSDILSNIVIRTDKNMLHLKRLLVSISSKALEVTSLMVEKSLDLAIKSNEEISDVCETLASIPGLLPPESQNYIFFSDSRADPQITEQNERLYRLRDRVLSHLIASKPTV